MHMVSRDHLAVLCTNGYTLVDIGSSHSTASQMQGLVVSRLERSESLPFVAKSHPSALEL
jgi:hypothetical protein